MIDYLHADITLTGLKALQEAGLVFLSPHDVNTETAELTKSNSIKAEQIAKLKNLEIHQYAGGKIKLYGSLHKFWNYGEHNYNQFTFDALKSVINELRDQYNIDPETATIHHIEYAVNLTGLPWTAEEVINSAMIHSVKGGPPILAKYCDVGTPSEYKKISRENVLLKMYDKGLQSKLEDNILRIEGKNIRMIELNKAGISTLSDLLKPETTDILKNELLSLWDGIILDDWTIREGELTKEETSKLKDWRRPKYWTDLHKKTRKKSRNKGRLELNKYKKLVQVHSDNVHGIIRQEIINTWCKLTTGETMVQDVAKVQDHTYIMGEPAPIPKICPITGVDISEQKEGSKFISPKTLKAMGEEKSKLIKEYGPKTKKAKDKGQEYEDYCTAHNVRNKESNHRAALRKRVNEYKNSIFPFHTEEELYLREPKK